MLYGNDLFSFLIFLTSYEVTLDLSNTLLDTVNFAMFEQLPKLGTFFAPIDFEFSADFS
jgi:hypothetical protein